MKEAGFQQGDVVKLTDYGAQVFKTEWYNASTPPAGSTAVVKEVIQISEYTNHEYVIEFFCHPGRVWGCYYGEIVAV